VRIGEGEMGEEVRLGIGQQLGDRRKRGRMLSMTRPDCSRAERSSGCSKIERMAEAIMLRAWRGTRSWALRVQCTGSAATTPRGAARGRP